MENASKALIIAGAILVSILLISVGVLIINSTRNITEQPGQITDTMEKDNFNAQFTVFEGTANSAAQIKSLVSKIKASNATYEAPNVGDFKHVEIVWNPTTLKPATLSANKRYTVELDYTDGYVSSVTISVT